jgi:hypothetical protein
VVFVPVALLGASERGGDGVGLDGGAAGDEQEGAFFGALQRGLALDRYLEGIFKEKRALAGVVIA